MTDINWRQEWQQAQSDPHRHLVLALLSLNGLSIAQIARLPEAQIDTSEGWLTTFDGDTYPLTTYAQDALATLFGGDTGLDIARLQAVCDTYALLEPDAHRRLSGAIWISDPELQLTLETTGSADTPILPLRFTFPFSVADRLQAGEDSDVARDAGATLQAAADWLVEQTLTGGVSLLGRLIGIMRQGSLVFLVASTGVSGLNLVHNVLMGRLLSPADYSQLTLLITLQLLVGLLPTALQTVTARFSARYIAQSERPSLAALCAATGRFGWLAGIGSGAILLLLAPMLVNLFQLDGLGLLLPLVLVLPFYVRMGADRGVLQGLGSYFWLSGAYLSEGVIRLGLSVILGYALLTYGQALPGTVWGLAQSMLATWFIGWLALRHFSARTPPDAVVIDRGAWLTMGRMTAFVLIGQALITNSDFFLVKTFFTPDEAGLYAAVSVLGRIVYFGALPLTVLLVPLVARRQALNEPTRPILMLLIGGGVTVCGGLVLGAALFAPLILGLLYGDAYTGAAGLLAPYALAASLYTLTNLVVTYQIALGSGGETWMPAVAGALQIVAVMLFHETLAQVIGIQIVLMSALLAVVLWRVLRPAHAPPPRVELLPPVAG